MDNLKISGIAGGTLILGLTVGSMVREDATTEAKQMASEITGIPVEMVDKSIRETADLDVKTVPEHDVKYSVDSVAGKDTIKLSRTARMEEQTQWDYTINSDHWISWQSAADETALKLMACYMADTGGVIKEQSFYPGKDIIEKYNGVAVQVSYQIKMIPLYGVKTR